MLAGDINAIRITEEGYREEMREKEKVANEGRKEVKKREEKKREERDGGDREGRRKSGLARTKESQCGCIRSKT